MNRNDLIRTVSNLLESENYKNLLVIGLVGNEPKARRFTVSEVHELLTDILNAEGTADQFDETILNDIVFSSFEDNFSEEDVNQLIDEANSLLDQEDFLSAPIKKEYLN